jgi:hypothetical protein
LVSHVAILSDAITGRRLLILVLTDVFGSLRALFMDDQMYNGLVKAAAKLEHGSVRIALFACVCLFSLRAFLCALELFLLADYCDVFSLLQETISFTL